MTDVEEKWLPVAGASDYSVSNLGRVKNKHGAITSGTKKPSGYMATTIDRKPWLIHRLVASVWLPPASPEKTEINHLNNRRDDNRVDNLEWVTRSENVIKRATTGKNDTKARKVIQKSPEGILIKLWESQSAAAKALEIRPSDISKACSSGYICRGYRWERHVETRPLDEVWKPIEIGHHTIEVSSLGFVRSRTGYITRGGRNSYGYRMVDIGGKAFAAHRLVAQAFLPDWKPELLVNHKDGVKDNNTVPNLEMVTAKGNVAHAIASGLRGKGGLKRSVIRIAPDGSEITFESAAEGARQSGCNKGNIANVLIGKGLTAGGYRWQYAEQLPAIKPEEKAEEAAPLPDDDPLWAELLLAPCAPPDSLLTSLRDGLASLSDPVTDDDPLWAELGLDD